MHNYGIYIILEPLECTPEMGVNHDIMKVEELNESWKLANPSPWISASEFEDTFFNEQKNAISYKGQYIIDNPNIIWALPYLKGDVVQYTEEKYGFIREASHTMYITHYLSSNLENNQYPSYGLTYQSLNKTGISLLDIAKTYPDKYFLFYDFTE